MSALISEFDFSPLLHTPCAFSFLEAEHFGEARGLAVVSLNQNQGHLDTYFILFLVGREERRPRSLAFYFLFVPFSQSKNPRTAHLGSEGTGTLGSVRVWRGRFQKPSGYKGGSGGNS